MSGLAQHAAACVGVGLATLCVLLNPDRVVLGGGVAIEAGEPFRSRAEQIMRFHAVPFFSQQTQVMLAQAGASAGLLGAASLIFFQAIG